MMRRWWCEMGSKVGGGGEQGGRVAGRDAARGAFFVGGKAGEWLGLWRGSRAVGRG